MAPYPDYPIPANEAQRLRSLERYGLLDTASNPYLKKILNLATDLLGTPIALVSLVDERRQWFLSRHGLEVEETPRQMAFCAHAIAGDHPLIVPDALEDDRFNTNPLVLEGPRNRFYAGIPLKSSGGYNLGTLCVIDHKPHHPTPHQVERLQLIAELVMHDIELRHLALLCPVTGVFNRQPFFQLGAKEVAHTRERLQPLSLVNVDIDNFRLINNRWGHDAGDQVLRQFAKLCQDHLQEQDLIGRIGDEEFGLLLVGRDETSAMVFAQNLHAVAATMPGVHTPKDYHLAISGGVTSLSPSDQGFEDLFNRADRALDLAKANGRNRVALVQQE
jgi:diguanylate cyclase (GGDEF)-like protein